MSIRLYPVQSLDSIQQSKLSHPGYRVSVNGIAAPTDTARVSAVPYNRRWPGHQRGTDQTERISFLSLAADEPLTFEITLPEEPTQAVVIRPRSLGITPEVTDSGTVRFTLPHPAYFTVEPYGRQNALHVFVDPMETELPDRSDPGLIYYGPGVHEVGQIELTEGQTLYLDAGAVVYACITAKDAEHIRILGRGVLDNSHNREILLYESHTEENDSAVENAVRQHTVQLEYCTDVLIDGITIRDSLVYNIRPIGCRNLTVRNVKIIGCWRYNADGIDMHNCEDVEIDGCFLRTFDDSVCVKGFDCYYDGDVEQAVWEAMHHGGKVYDCFRNVRVHDCVIWNDWGKCLEIGAETRAEEICNVVFEDCDVIHTTGAVLDCCNVDYADVHDITYRNIRVELDEAVPPPRYQYHDSEPYGAITPGYVPTLICSQVIFHHEYSAGGSRRGRNRNLCFEDIRILGDVTPSVYIEGYSDTAECRDITVKHVTVDGRLLRSEADFHWNLGAHCENVRYLPGDSGKN